MTNLPDDCSPGVELAEGCGDPECIACRIRGGEQPSPMVLSEFASIYARMEAMADRSAARPITITPSAVADHRQEGARPSAWSSMRLPKGKNRAFLTA